MHQHQQQQQNYQNTQTQACREIDSEDSQIQIKKILQQLETPSKDLNTPNTSNHYNHLEKQLIHILKKLQIPFQISNYADVNYWNQRYLQQGESQTDWLQSYSSLKPYLQQILNIKQQTAKILYVGCGNSKLAEDLYYDGYKFITCLDFSSIVINQMQQRYQKQFPEIQFLVMDATKLKTNERIYDLVIDKGTFDAVASGDNCVDNIKNMLLGIFKTLKPDGIFCCLSYGEPSIRMNYFQNVKLWDIQIFEIKKPNETPLDQLKIPNKHYLYICQKLQMQPQQQIKQNQ